VSWFSLVIGQNVPSRQLATSSENLVAISSPEVSFNLKVVFLKLFLEMVSRSRG